MVYFSQLEGKYIKECLLQRCPACRTLALQANLRIVQHSLREIQEFVIGNRLEH